VHDLTPSGIVIPKDNKLKSIFCLTEWHSNYLKSIFPILKDIIKPFNYGIDDRFKNETSQKIKNKFIYSSFPNRGLLQLLQMWPKIYEKEPSSSLYIYSDVNNKWSNDVEPQKMNEIKTLLNIYNGYKNGLGIQYRGWINKKELAYSWLNSEFWFYPCTFMETFCLTALEAASSKTFVITNDLAALQNTVGDRGAIINGDPTTQAWQDLALQKLFYYMDEKNKIEKEKFININYEWSLNLTWEKQANKLIKEYIEPNSILEYKGMYNWTNDSPSGSKDIYLEVINYFNNTYHKFNKREQIIILEIGSYAGISLINLVKAIPNSIGYGIDMWEYYNENKLLENMDNLKVESSFYHNIEISGFKDRIFGIKSRSTDKLMEFIKKSLFKADFIYVDSSHLLIDCYTDLFLSWEILQKDGVLVINNYYYKKDEILNSPYEAVNHFLKIYENKYKLLHSGYRVFLQKL
jgi:predicted O-methyltransferase YrrM